MMCCYLDLGQLWRCPVEWCAVWKGSVRECRDHFNDKHSGSATLEFGKVSRSFPAWTVTRDFWEHALKPEISGIAVDIRLFHESGRRLIHKYRVYQDQLPHPALREGRITKLLSFVNRAMVIAQLTHLRIEIPSLAGLDRIRSLNRRRSCRRMKSSTKCEKPAPAEDFLFRDILCAPTMGLGRNQSWTESTGNKD